MQYDDISYAKSLEMLDTTCDTQYFSKCVVLARYWIFNCNLPKVEYTDLIYSKVRMSLPDFFGEEFIQNKVYQIIQIANVKGQLTSTIVKFSKEELDCIHSINDIQLEKILFSLLYLYKVNDNSAFEFHHKEIMELSKHTRKVDLLNKRMFSLRQMNMAITKPFHFKTYCEIGKQLTEKYNDNNVVLTITNHNNIIDYYLMYLNPTQYRICEHCGEIFKVTGKTHKYCNNCSAESRRKSKREYMQKIRQIC